MGRLLQTQHIYKGLPGLCWATSSARLGTPLVTLDFEGLERKDLAHHTSRDWLHSAGRSFVHNQQSPDRAHCRKTTCELREQSVKAPSPI